MYVKILSIDLSGCNCLGLGFFIAETFQLFVSQLKLAITIFTSLYFQML